MLCHPGKRQMMHQRVRKEVGERDLTFYNITSTLNITARVIQMDFHLQWWLFDNKDNYFKDAMLLASPVMIKRPPNVTKVT